MPSSSEGARGTCGRLEGFLFHQLGGAVREMAYYPSLMEVKFPV